MGALVDSTILRRMGSWQGMAVRLCLRHNTMKNVGAGLLFRTLGSSCIRRSCLSVFQFMPIVYC
jgi:hypothetical protein